MKFFNTAILAVLSISFTALAAPVEIKQRQVTTPVGAINNAISTLQDTISSDEAAITTAISQASSQVSASVQAEVQANIQGIANAVLQATGTIVSATSGGIRALTAPEIESLIADVQTVNTLVTGILATLTSLSGSLIGTGSTLIQQEITATENLLLPFIVPILAFASTISNSSPASVGNALGSTLQSSTGALASILGQTLSGLGTKV